MHSLVLGHSGVETSRLGFGCVQLTAHRERCEALAILEHAFAQGITHFDVARVYGFGRAESILGEFLRGKRHLVTVATKFGLQPPAGLAGNGRIINAAKKILSPFPSLLRRAKARGAAMGKSGVFSPEAAIRSLETSLQELKTDYVDVLLLHEARRMDAVSEGLVETLGRQVEAGKARCIGIASDFEKLGRQADQLPALYQVLQFNDDAAAGNLAHLIHGERHGIITHSIFKPVKQLRNAIAVRPHIAREFSLRMNVDLSNPAVVTAFLLHCALRSNKRGTVLFSSTHPQHISVNVRQLEAPDYDEAQSAQFLEFVQEMIGQRTCSGAATPTHHSSSN